MTYYIYVYSCSCSVVSTVLLLLICVVYVLYDNRFLTELCWVLVDTSVTATQLLVW